ncbi:MAG: glycosyltransferase family 4 protein [Chloroflexi bacterium]|nr:glycosyltransferase family 4 protein [Chloroflexota bacterium]
MRIALIGPVPPALGGQTPGGVATHQVYLAQGLVAAGVEVSLLATNTSVCPDRFGPACDLAALPIYRMVTPLRADPHTVAALGGYPRVGRYGLAVARMRQHGSRREVLRNVLAYRRFMAEVCPDLIHVQHPLERSVYVRTVQRVEGWRQPLVVTAHSLFGEHPDATIHSLMAPNLRAADRVIAVSEHIASQAVDLGIDASRVRVIRSGVDTRQFRPTGAAERDAARQRLGIPRESPLILFVGNLEPRKQLEVLLRAMPRVRQDVPEVQLLVVGSGESAGALDQTTPLRQLSEALGLTDTVRFVGRLSQAQLEDAYAAADVFALPSSSEAQGIVALEAMACGLAVVASAVGGLVGTITDQESGYLVPSGDVEALTVRLTELLCDSERRTAMGRSARQAVERRFTWSHTVAATCEVYREVLGCR